MIFSARCNIRCIIWISRHSALPYRYIMAPGLTRTSLSSFPCTYRMYAKVISTTTGTLAGGDDDPRVGLLSALRKYTGENGSIVAYNKSFEENVLKELAAAFPEYAEWINGILPRFVDLITPFRNFSYYNPVQHGSASLKKVLPAITGSGYEGMAIARGDDASLAYLDMAFGDITEEKINEIRESLLAYCGLDTEAMARIIGELYKFI